LLEDLVESIDVAAMSITWDVVAESVRLRRTLRGLGVFADIVVVSELEAEQWRDVRGSLIHAVFSDGRAMAA
jgi:hypothetical protein